MDDDLVLGANMPCDNRRFSLFVQRRVVANADGKRRYRPAHHFTSKRDHDRRIDPAREICNHRYVSPEFHVDRPSEDFLELIGELLWVDVADLLSAVGKIELVKNF